MGGGTTRVGDPSGKDESRKILTDDDINRTSSAFARSFQNSSSSATGHRSIMANNADWLNSLNYIDFCATSAGIFDQPHAGLRLGEDADRARTGTLIP